jgi:hypothetical protein
MSQSLCMVLVPEHIFLFYFSCGSSPITINFSDACNLICCNQGKR